MTNDNRSAEAKKRLLEKLLTNLTQWNYMSWRNSFL